MVYKDLNESDYIFIYGNLKLYFSSKFYYEKFEKTYADFIKEELAKFKLKYKCNIHDNELFILLLYKKIEKRGFRVDYKNQPINENYIIDYIII